MKLQSVNERIILVRPDIAEFVRDALVERFGVEFDIDTEPDDIWADVFAILKPNPVAKKQYRLYAAGLAKGISLAITHHIIK